MDGKYAVIPMANLKAFKDPLIELVKTGTPAEVVLAQMMVRTFDSIMSVGLRREAALDLFKSIYEDGYECAEGEVKYGETGTTWDDLKTEL